MYMYANHTVEDMEELGWGIWMGSGVLVVCIYIF